MTIWGAHAARVSATPKALASRELFFDYEHEHE